MLKKDRKTSLKYARKMSNLIFDKALMSSVKIKENHFNRVWEDNFV